MGQCIASPALLNPHFSTKHQRFPASSAQIAPPLPHQGMTLSRESKVTVGARAAIDIARNAAALHSVSMATIGWQFVNTPHDQLPFFTMGLNACAEQLMGDQMRHFMGNGLFKKIVAIFLIQLWIETQHIFVKVRDTGLLAAQFEADYGAFEGTLEKIFGLLITDFNAG